MDCIEKVCREMGSGEKVLKEMGAWQESPQTCGGVVRSYLGRWDVTRRYTER